MVNSLMLVTALSASILIAPGCASDTVETTAQPTPLDARTGEEERRLRMVQDDIAPRGVSDERVLDVMRIVPRHHFVPERYRSDAYDDRPLPIGHGQTISQPLIVASMTELLGVEPDDTILEVGTGSGYQAAVLAELGVHVFSIEIIPELAKSAKSVLNDLGYGGIQTKVADGYFGWEEHAPFDGIIVTAAPDHIPSALLAQLKPTGRMVIPVGPPGGVQTLWLVEKRDGEWISINQGNVIFVPLVQH